MIKQGLPDAWLLHNLSNKDATLGADLLGSPNDSFRLRILPILLAISTLIVAAMWYEEDRLNLMSAADRIGYPILLVVTAFGAILLKLRPDTLRIVMVAAFTSYIAYLLSSYYIEMAHRVFDGISSSYEMTALALWFPFGYVGSFVFFSPPVAVRASLAICAAISLPPLVLLGIDSDAISRLIYLEALISQPIYIAALWGVGLLKAQASGVHDFAQSLNKVATIDALTGIANRRAMDHVLEKVTQSQLLSERPLALLMIDVDNFKKINDTYGHALGDEVLIKLAQEATAHLRASDLLGRWGGEEFMIISLDQTGHSAYQMAERLRSELERISFPQVGTVTVSIGLTSHLPGEDIDQFISRADRALYRAKARGRNCVEVAHAS